MTDPANSGTSSLGGTVGRRLARVVADASAATRAKSMPAYVKVAETVMDRFWRTVDREAQAAMRPLLQPIVEHPDTPPELREMLRAASFPTGQWQAFLAQNVAGTTLSVGLGALLNNLLAGPVQEQLARLPNALLDPGTAAAMAARDIQWSRSASQEAARSAISGDRFAALVELNHVQPGLPEVLALLHRGIITATSARDLLQRSGYGAGLIEPLLALGQVVLTPEQLAAMWNRSIVDTSQGRALAALSGMEPGDFDRLTELGGDPLPLQDLAEAFRRGFIDQARFNRGVVQGPLRNEWFDVLEQLQERRMSPQNAAQAVLQGKMSLQDGQQVARAAGLAADDFATIIDSTGQPPGIATMQEAWNRGIINEADFTRAFLESNLKNDWIDTIKDLRFRTMPREQINLTYRLGGFTREEALRRYIWDGWSTADAEAMMFSEEQRQLGSERDLSVAMIRELYEADAITENDAIDFYRSIGYSDENVALLLAIADIRKRRRVDNLAVSRVRSRFIGFRIDQREAENALDRIGVIPAERDTLMETWAIEREISMARLTTSQIQQALKRGLIDGAGALDRLRENGYTDEDATILVNLATPAGGGE